MRVVQHLKKQRQQTDQLQKLQQKQHRQKLLQQEAITHASKEISVNSREDGSGTRGAFIELFGVEEKAADGTKVDNTTVEANITNSTAVMMTSVAGDPYAISYISLGSLK